MQFNNVMKGCNDNKFFTKKLMPCNEMTQLASLTKLQ